MREVQANIWKTNDADAIAITTNGISNRAGAAIMGAGIAKQAADRYPELPYILGNLLAARGNRVHDLGVFDGIHLVSYPTKHHWRDHSDPTLVYDSAVQLSKLADTHGWQKVGLPRPGCGFGGLLWEEEVKPLLAGILDDRFIVVDVMP
jgi:hypothetical protein